jgi:hypothetical protein
MYKELGKVRRVYLEIEDHGCLWINLDIDFGGSGQGFGCVALDDWDEKKKRRVGTAGGLDFIIQILNLFGAKRLNEIEGKPVFALYTNEHHFGDKIIGLETPKFDGGKSFLIEDWRNEWFS